MKKLSPQTNAGNMQAVKRMPQYLRLFNDMLKYGRQYISSVEIASKLSLRPILVKKDMLLAKAPGKTRLGYNVKGSITAIQNFLGWQKERDVCLVGYGKLGSALFHYEGFKKHGFNMVAAFDTDITKADNDKVLHIEHLASYVQSRKINTAIISVPAYAAQGVADTLVSAGIKAIWNFSPADIKVPSNIALQNEDLSIGLALLCLKLKN
ncbi:MAG: redox-sensing transcriptional repressor Rex [Elusimicrobiaceae bacterium]|nr:redox-sensing transcriptional repressor Rex [Elusimicrobiota bacterium]